MRVRNETGLPDPIVRIAQDLTSSHPRMDDRQFSATEVLNSVRQIVLKRRHYDEIERDVQDCFKLWLGTAVHDKLERVAVDNPEYITETRLEMPVDTITGRFTLSGEFDLLDIRNNILYDYKTTSVATIDGNRSLKEDKWLRQLYVYAEMIEKCMSRPRPEKAVIIAMATDWSKMKTLQSASYPRHPIQMLEWPLDDAGYREKVMAEVRNKMETAEHYLENPDEELPKCTNADCWCTEDWAIMKEGASRAVKTFTDEETARGYYLNLSEEDRKKLRLYHRTSDYRNCRLYCDCAPFCSQWARNCHLEKVAEDITDVDFIPF